MNRPGDRVPSRPTRRSHTRPPARPTSPPPPARPAQPTRPTPATRPATPEPGNRSHKLTLTPYDGTLWSISPAGVSPAIVITSAQPDVPPQRTAQIHAALLAHVQAYLDNIPELEDDYDAEPLI